MFNGSRFFNLLRKWKDEPGKSSQIIILQDVMDHYFGSIAGYMPKNKLTIHGKYSAVEIAIVLDSVGYHGYSIDNSNIDKAVVILRNSL